MSIVLRTMGVFVGFVYFFLSRKTAAYCVNLFSSLGLLVCLVVFGVLFVFFFVVSFFILFFFYFVCVFVFFFFFFFNDMVFSLIHPLSISTLFPF